METRTTSKKGQLIRRLHTLRGAVGMTQDEYETLLESYGVESSKELDERRLELLCAFLQKQAGGSRDLDTLRKRLLAAVCAFCENAVPQWERMDGAVRIAYAKAVACRAAGVGEANFNRIGTDRLRSLTYAFQKRNRDMDQVINAARQVI